jgi:hypothetical protein
MLHMSVEAMVAVRDLPKQGISLDPRNRFVLYALANYADDTGKCWPSYRTLEQWTGYTRRSIIRTMNELRQLGLVTTEARQRDNGSAASNIIRLVFMDPQCQADTRVVTHSHQGSDTVSPLELSLELPIEPTTKVKDKEQNLVENAKTVTTAIVLSATPTRVSNKQLLDIWNQHCGVLPRVTRLNDKRNDAFDHIRREFGDDTEECFTNAVKQVASDDHWIAKPYGLDNLLVRGRVLEKHEKYLASGTMSKGDRAMANTAMRIMHAIGGFDAN